MPTERPTRDAYVAWETVTTRWADIDVYGHMNNARYFELIDTVVNNQLLYAVDVDIRELPAIGVVAEVGCRYFAEIGYPDPIDLGIVVDKIGRSSVVYRVGLFQGDGDQAAADSAPLGGVGAVEATIASFSAAPVTVAGSPPTSLPAAG